MRRRLLGSVVACAAVGLALFGFAACDEPTDPGDSGGSEQLAKVDVTTISVREEVFFNGTLGTVFSWDAVENAGGYSFTCNGTTVNTTYPAVTVQSFDQIVMPADGVFNVSIVATPAPYTPYTDSEPVSYTYTVRGCELNGITVTGIENGVLKWKADRLASGYLVSVNGGANVPVATNEYDLSGTAGALTVKVSAAGDGLYTKTGAPLTVNVNAAHTKLQYSPVTDYTVEGGVVSWKAMAGVKKYKVVDIERNFKIVEALSYDYSEKLPVYGVYPVSDSSFIEDAEITRVDIPYLEGMGTNDSPYQIKSAIDFRAIDYYEACYAERLKENPNAPKTYYAVTANINFDAVNVPDDVSNFYPLTQPFYGTLNGNGAELSNIRVRHKSGYWAMFDYIAPGAVVMNMKFVSADIQNEMALATLPINASIATVAYKNYGIIANITVKDATYKAAGGEIAGICWQNNGTVQRCEVGGNFEQKATGQKKQACYEMAGVVAENYGIVRTNTVKTLEIRGTAIPDGSDPPYNNVRCAAGIVAVNRKGGSVTDNSFENLSMTTVLPATENEFGGVVAYNAPGATVRKGTGTFGTFTHNGTAASQDIGKTSDFLGRLIGKNQGSGSLS